MRNFVALGAVGTAIAVLGLVILRKVRGNLVGPLLTWVGAITVFLAVRDAAGGRAVALLDESGWWLFVAVALLLLYFPDGRLPSPRWRAPAVLLMVCCAIQQVAA